MFVLTSYSLTERTDIMDRITLAQLQAICARINRVTGSPPEPYVKQPDGRYVAQIGCYLLSQAYGGVALHRMHNSGGGVSDVFGGHIPRRQLADRMYAFLAGIDAAREQQS